MAISKTDDGMQIDERDEHHKNAFDSIRETLEPDSNVTIERDPQLQKHSLPIRSTNAGMQTDTETSSQAGRLKIL
jgi:hypothetical protein